MPLAQAQLLRLAEPLAHPLGHLGLDVIVAMCSAMTRSLLHVPPVRRGRTTIPRSAAGPPILRRLSIRRYGHDAGAEKPRCPLKKRGAPR